MSLLDRFLGRRSQSASVDDAEYCARACAAARALYDAGRFHEALQACLHLYQQGHDDPGFLVLLGEVQLRFGQIADAEGAFRRAVGRNGANARAQHGLADALTRQRRYDEAIAVCGAALALHPDAGEIRMVLGDCQRASGDQDSAEDSYVQAATSPGTALSAHFAFGTLMRAQGRHQEAAAAFAKVEELRGAGRIETDAFIDLALAYEALGESARGLAVLEAELAKRPVLEAHRLFAQLLLAHGRLREGWEHFEFRWMLEPLLATRLGPVRPPWVGQDLRGKTILLRLEQGFGDVIQFVRYAQHVKALGATVLMPDFSNLAKSVVGVDRVIQPEERPPPFDYYVNLLSLPRVFGTDLDSIPGDVRYILPDPARVQKWQSRLAVTAGLKVGLVWAGNAAYSRDDQRSISIEMLEPLLAVKGVHFVLLQKGNRGPEAARLAPRATNLGPELDDFADTAAVIEQLDLVIAVDTAVAHLAGALGRPVWVLLPIVSDWRWMHDRDDSPWYPTMRLFRQDRDGGWANVINRLVRELERHLHAGMSQWSQPIGIVAQTRRLRPLPIGLAAKSSAAVAETRVGIVQYQPGQPLVGESIAQYGEWLPAAVDVLARMVVPGSTVMEVDAGIGMHALAIAAMVGASGHMVLAETDPARRCILQQNLAANRVANVTVLAAAGRLDVGTVDDLQLARLDWLKINDGLRAGDVLQGATGTLWQRRPNLFIDASNAGELCRLQESVQTFGYRLWSLKTPLFESGNFYCNRGNVFGDRTVVWLLAIPEEVTIDLPNGSFHELS